MYCYNTPGPSGGLGANSKEFLRLKFLIKCRLKGKSDSAAAANGDDGKL